MECDDILYIWRVEIPGWPLKALTVCGDFRRQKRRSASFVFKHQRRARQDDDVPNVSHVRGGEQADRLDVRALRDTDMFGVSCRIEQLQLVQTGRARAGSLIQNYLV